MSSTIPKTITQKNWVCHAVAENRVRCEWTFPHALLMACDQVGRAIQSPMFYTGDGEQQWHILLYPCGRNEDTRNKITFALLLASSKTFGIHMDLDISILKSNCVIFESRFNADFDHIKIMGHPILIDRSILFSEDFSDIKLIIDCETNRPAPKEDLIGNLRGLLDDPKFSDVTIIVADHKFPAHKNILSARSPLFAAMFNFQEINENHLNEVKIENLEPPVVKGMLEYIYTGAVEDLKELAMGLLEAAEKYDLEILKKLCEDDLCEILNVNNAVDILILADLYRARKLKNYALKIINDNLHDVIQTDGYERIHLALLKEVVAFGLRT